MINTGLSKIIKEVSEEVNIPEEVVSLAYKSYWEFIRIKIQSLPLKEDLDEETFNKLKTNFNIPSLGKFVLSWDRYKGVKQHFNYRKNA